MTLSCGFFYKIIVILGLRKILCVLFHILSLKNNYNVKRRTRKRLSYRTRFAFRTLEIGTKYLLYVTTIFPLFTKFLANNYVHGVYTKKLILADYFGTRIYNKPVCFACLIITIIKICAQTKRVNAQLIYVRNLDITNITI